MHASNTFHQCILCNSFRNKIEAFDIELTKSSDNKVFEDGYFYVYFEVQWLILSQLNCFDYGHEQITWHCLIPMRDNVFMSRLSTTIIHIWSYLNYCRILKTDKQK